MKKPYAIAGSILINAGIVLIWLSMWWAAFWVYAAVGVIDLYLVKRKKPTISMWVWGRWNAWADIGIAIAMVAVTWIVHGTPFAVVAIAFVIQGHLRWQSSEGESPMRKR